MGCRAINGMGQRNTKAAGRAKAAGGRKIRGTVEKGCQRGDKQGSCMVDLAAGEEFAEAVRIEMANECKSIAQDYWLRSEDAHRRGVGDPLMLLQVGNAFCRISKALITNERTSEEIGNAQEKTI